jgi:malonyl-CoA O-methyltransferase
VVDMEIITVEYTSLSNLLKDLRNAAANNAHQQRAKGLGGRRAWAEFESAWNTLAQSTGKLAVPIRFEVIYGHAWNELSNTLTDGRSIVHFDPKARISRSPKL